MNWAQYPYYLAPSALRGMMDKSYGRTHNPCSYSHLKNARATQKRKPPGQHYEESRGSKSNPLVIKSTNEARGADT